MLMQAAESGAGRHAKCPGCGQILVIPKATAAVPVPPPPPAAPPPVSATAMQAAMPVPPAEMRPPAPLSLDELLGDTSPPRPAGAKTVGAAALVKKPIASGAHKLGGRVKGKKDAGLSNTALRNLGIAAIAIGVLAGALFWLPFAGPAVALAGLGAGLVAMFVGSSRRSAPMGLALAGSAVSFIALAIGGYWTYSSLTKPADNQIAAAGTKTEGDVQPAGQGAVDDSTSASTPMPKISPAATAARFAEGAATNVAGGDPRDDREPLKFAAGATRGVLAAGSNDVVAATARASKNGAKTTPKLVFGADGSAVVVTEKPEASAAETARDKTGSSEPAAPAPIQWAAAEKNESQGTGSLKVTITKVLVGRVPYYEIGGIDTLTDLTRDPLMTVWLKIRNGDAAGSVEYSGWMGVKADKEKTEATVADDHGHSHGALRNYFKADQALKGSVQGEGALKPIFAGQAVADAVVFPMPAEDAEYLELTLSGNAIGQEEPLHFRIPKSMIKQDESNPLIGGAGN